MTALTWAGPCSSAVFTAARMAGTPVLELSFQEHKQDAGPGAEQPGLQLALHAGCGLRLYRLGRLADPTTVFFKIPHLHF